MKATVALLMTVWAGACASRAAGPPVIAIDRSACTRCGMLISERAHAAAIRLPDGTDQLFDDIGCLLATARGLSAPDVRYWFHDAADGEWIDGGKPVFLVSESLRTPMGGGIVAYRNRATADRFAREHAGRVVTDFAALIAQAGSSK